MATDTFQLIYFTNENDNSPFPLSYTAEFEHEYTRRTGLQLENFNTDPRVHPITAQLLEEKGSVWVCGYDGLRCISRPIELKNYWSIICYYGRELVYYKYDKMKADLLDLYMNGVIGTETFRLRYARIIELNAEYSNMFQAECPKIRTVSTSVRAFMVPY